MKYIRTKDGIYKLTCWFNNSGNKENEPYKIIGGQMITGQNHYFNFSMEEIIKQADTIEELCDEFDLFYDTEETEPDLTYRGGFNDLYFQNELKHSAKCYGAIWTDKGLIYVAKMNDKGELELL